MFHRTARLCVFCLFLSGAFASLSILAAAGAQEAKPGEQAAKSKPAGGGSAAAAAKEVFRTHCFVCHGGSKSNAGVKILDRDLLVTKKKKVVPGKPDESILYQLVTAQDDSVMPPQGQARLSPEEIDTIRRWIAEGAAAFPADAPAPAENAKDKALKDVVGVDYVLKQILAHVRTLKREDRPFVRYFSLNHTLTGGATNEELDLHRDALAKAINHLSWERELIRPHPIEPTSTVFYIDLRQLGWHKQVFERISNQKVVGRSEYNVFDLALLEYPYGMIYEDSETYDQLVDEYLEPAYPVRPIPYVRADWFVSFVTQPPLYDDFLQLPFTLDELEKKLGVDSQANLDHYVAKRGGMTVSGVSKNNRVVERHPSNYGAYWKSFDFRSSKGRENMFKDPVNLNPSGGEMIFNLPNGLQGYYVADAKGNRLDFAPTDIVTDKFAEDKTVRNGLACMRCHDGGMKGFADVVRPAVEHLPGSPGFDKRQVLQLYPEQKELDRYLKEDAGRFEAALRGTLGKPQTREPLIPVSKRFLDAPLHLPAASAELGLPEPAGLNSLFRLPQFASLGLVPLASEGVVRRDMWEDYYDQVVRHLGIGIPIVPLDGLTRREFQPNPSAFDLQLKTNRANNVFAPGDKLTVTVSSKSSKPIYLELIGVSSKGRKFILAPSTTVIKAGQPFTWSTAIKPGVGREQFIVFACDAVFPPGELLRGHGVVDRVVHSFYRLERGGTRLRLPFDPSRMVKKTLEIETR